MATVKNKMNGAYKSPSPCKSRKKSSISQRIVSLFLAFITTFLAVGIMPWTAQDIYAETPKTGYHKGSLTKTYNIVKLDDQSYFSDCGGTYGGYRDSTKSKFSWPYEEYCGEIEADAEGYAGHWYKQAASYYGFYDEIYKAWVMTGVQVYGGKSNRVQIDDPASCNHTHDSTAFNYNTRSWEAAEIPKEKKIGDLYGNGEDGISLVSKEGCTVTFTETIHISGTVSVTYPDTWVPDEYTITFYPENSEGSFSKMVTYDAENNNDVSSSVPSKAGYSFGGWYTQKDGRGTKAYDASGKAVKGTYWSADGGTAVWKGTSDISLYAYWIQDTVTQTVEFYLDGNKKVSRTYEVSIGITFSPESKKDDVESDAKFAHSHFSKADASYSVTAARTSRVYFETNTLSIKYDGNGATSGKTSSSVTAYGSKVTVASNGFVKTGYTFSGWNTKSNGTGDKYTAGKTITAQPENGNIELTLYAQWSKNKYKVALSKGTGIASVSGAGEYSYGSEVNISATPSTGYIFSKWSDNSTSNPRKFIMPASNVSYTASATAKTYSITFNANGGSNTGSLTKTNPCVMTYDKWTNWDMSTAIPIKSGYAFTGWYTATSNGIQVYDKNGKATGNYWSGDEQHLWKRDEASGKLTLYAHWKQVKSPTVSVSQDSVADYCKSINIKITASADVSDETTVALSGSNSYQYCLTTNSSKPSGSWINYVNGQQFTIGNNLSGVYYLYVKPVKDSLGNSSLSSGYHKFGPYKFDNTAPDLSNVSMSYGWYPEGTIIDFNISDSHSGIKSAVLTDFNGIELSGGDITSTRQFYFGTENVSLYTLTVTDYCGNQAQHPFIVKIDKKCEVIPKNSVWKGLSNVTVFAHWIPNTYTVVFDKNDNDGSSVKVTGSMSNLKVTYDKSILLPANKYVRDGYVFKGWNTSADGTGTTYADKATIKNLTVIPGGEVILYAIWQDTTAPVITVTPGKTSNISPVLNDAMRSIDVNVKVEEHGSGLSTSNKYEFALTSSRTTIPVTSEWKEYESSQTDNVFVIAEDIKDLGKSLTGEYYLWVRKVSDCVGNNSVVSSNSTGYVGDVSRYHVFGLYVFDNNAPTGTVTYTENNQMLGLYNESATQNPYAVISVTNGKDDYSGVKSFTLVIAEKDNESNSVSYVLTKDDSNYSCKFNLYSIFSNRKDISQVTMRIIAEDNLGNKRTLPVKYYDFGTRQSGDPITGDDIGYVEIIDSSDNAGGDDDIYYIRDAFRVEAAIHDATGDRQFAKGQLGFVDVYTFGNVETITIDFGSLCNYVNVLNGISLPSYTWDVNPNLGVTVVNHGDSGFYKHEFFIPLYAPESTYTDTVVTGTKKERAQYRMLSYDVKGTVLDDIKTILKYGED